MSNVLVLVVVGVASFAVWLRVRKNIVPADPNNVWFTMLKPQPTDPDTPWFNLLRQIEGGDVTVPATTPPPSAGTPTTAAAADATAPAPAPATATTPAVVAPAVPFLQWLASDQASILGTYGTPTSVATPTTVAEVGSWKPQKGSITKAYQFTVYTMGGGKGTVTSTVDAKQRRVIDMPTKSYLMLEPSNPPALIGSCVFLAYAWPLATSQTEELFGHISVNDTNRTVGLVAADVIGDANKLKDQNLHELSGRGTDVNNIDATKNNRVFPLSQNLGVNALDTIMIVGLQVLPTVVRFVNTNGNHQETSIVMPISSLPDLNPGGIHVGSKITQGTNERHLYEIRIYPNVSFSVDEMKAVWKEMNATYNPVPA